MSTQAPESMSAEERASLVRAHLAVTPRDDVLVATAPDWFGPVLFGGFVLAQAVAAATHAAPPGRRLHSLHAYFLRPVAGGEEVRYQNEVVRVGRTFSTTALRAEQNGKPVLTMTFSFTDDGDGDRDGYVYDLGAIGTGVPLPEDVEVGDGPPPWEAAGIGPSDPARDGTRESTHRMWFRVPAPLPDDPHLHTALMAYATDWTGVGGRPLHLEGDTQGMISLDHAAWFHRPANVNEWHFYDVQSLVNAGGRGLVRGVVRDREGRVVASMAQEMLLIPPA